MSYANIKPEYYRMFQPDSPWHAGAPGWKNAPWPGWGENPNLVGPPRLAVEGLGAAKCGGPVYQQVKGVGEYFQGTNGLGAYFAPKYERAINGLGKVGCGCSGVGDDASAPATSTTSTGMSSSTKGALMIGAAGIVLIALCVVPNIWDG